MNIKPLHDYVLVKPLDAESKTASGIILPDNAKEAPQVGVIMAVGPGAYEDGHLVQMSLKVGQKVLYKKWGGEDVKVEGEEWKLVKQADVVAVLDK